MFKSKKDSGQAAYEKHCRQVKFPKLQKPWHRLSDEAKAEFSGNKASAKK